MIVLEGIAVTGDPAFDLFKAAYPYRQDHQQYLIRSFQNKQIPGVSYFIKLNNFLISKLDIIPNWKF